MKRSLVVSALSGMSITLLLTFLSTLGGRYFPYQDLPMMPRPFFLYALSPGIMAGEPFQSVWISGMAFFLVNSIVYAIVCRGVMAIVRENASHRKRA